MVEAGLIVCTVFHLLSLILTVFRLFNRIWRHVFWFDDAFAAVIAFGTGLVVGALVESSKSCWHHLKLNTRLTTALVLKAPAAVALGHRLILGGCLLLIWYVDSHMQPRMHSNDTHRTSKAQSVMGLGRALACSYWPERAFLFLFLSLPLFVIGAAYFVFALLLCKIDANCSEKYGMSL